MKATTLTIGMFDSVHTGHRFLITKLINLAKKTNTKSTLITFDEIKKHPHGYLTTLEEKIDLLKKTGVDEIHILNFNSISNLTPEEFIDEVLIKKFNVKNIVVGENFRFGRNKSGDVKLLEKITTQRKINLKILPLKKSNHSPISSSLIKKMILKGRIKKANELLGRIYSISGEIRKGREIGKKIGFPTINLTPPKKKLLTKGIYLTFAKINNRIYPSLTYIGTKPTIARKGKMTVETHLLKFKNRLKSKKIEIGLLDKIRDERKFNSLLALKNQIKRDIKKAYKIWQKLKI